MAKFNVLQNNQRFMHSLGLYSIQNPLVQSTQKNYKTIPVYLISSPAICFIALAIWKLCDTSEPFLEKLDFFLYAISITQSIGAFLNIRFHMDQMTALHVHLQSMVNAQGWFAIHFLIFHKKKKLLRPNPCHSLMYFKLGKENGKSWLESVPKSVALLKIVHRKHIWAENFQYHLFCDRASRETQHSYSDR